MKWIFSVYDVNKDGVLSITELKELTASVRKILNEYKVLTDANRVKFP